MKHVNTVAGTPYAVTTSEACTISTAEGLTIAACEPGEQTIFVAPGDVVQVSAEEARLTETTGSAISALAGRRAKKELRAYVNEKTSSFLQEIADLREAAEEAVTEAAAVFSHTQQTAPHLQAGERERWNSPIPVGTILPSACAAMEGYLLCDGQAVSRTAYAALYAAIGDTYGAGDGESTFNVPDLRGRVAWGANAEQSLGSVIEAGLPNITGEISLTGSGTLNNRGAFFKTSNPYGQSISTNGDNNQISFDASHSNPIYGASDTVQPPAIALNFFIKY